MTEIRTLSHRKKSENIKFIEFQFSDFFPIRCFVQYLQIYKMKNKTPNIL